MPRRDRGGVLDADRAADEIEILDLDTYQLDSPDEIVESEPKGSLSPFAAAAGLVVAAIAMFGVVTTGNTPAPEPPTPLVTIPPEPPSPEEVARAAEVAELEATYGVEIGDGPDLNWQRLVWNIGVDRFQWIDDGFVGDNGETEWTIRPSMVGPTVSQRESLSVQFPGYRTQQIDGARLLLPTTGDADHLLAVVGDRDPIRIELPQVENAPVSDLVRPVRVVDNGVVDRDRVVISSFLHLEVDLEVLGSRVGRDLSGFDFVAMGTNELWPRIIAEPDEPGDVISFDEAGVTDDERADLARIGNDPGRSEVLSLDLVSAGSEPVSLANVQWVQTIARVPNGAAIVWSDLDDQNWLSTSSEAGVWSTRPVAVDSDRVWLSDSRLYSFPGSGRSIRRSRDLGSTWERTRRPFVSSFDNLAIGDLLIVAEAPPVNGNVPDLAVTRWDSTVGDPEWRIEPLDAIFNNAISVEFAAGGGHILAVVNSSNGTDFYLASTES